MDESSILQTPTTPPANKWGWNQISSKIITISGHFFVSGFVGQLVLTGLILILPNDTKKTSDASYIESALVFLPVAIPLVGVVIGQIRHWPTIKFPIVATSLILGMVLIAINLLLLVFTAMAGYC